MIDRRRFLACSGLAMAGIALPWPLRAEDLMRGSGPMEEAAPEDREALEVARQHIVRYCARPDFPNGALHAVRALGRNCPLGPGDPYVILLEDFVRENVIGNRLFLVSPIEKEGHRDSLLMNLLEKDCEPELEFQIQGRRYTFQDCIESARLRLEYPGTLPIDEHSWTLQALAWVTPPDQARWTNHWGRAVDLGQILDDTSSALHADTALIRQVDLSQEELPFDCPVFARACGGMHMLHAYAVVLAVGYATPERKRALAGHMQTAMRRLVYDMKITDWVEGQNLQIAGEEAAAVVAFDARVKFLGHLLETVAVVDRAKLYAFSPGERRDLVAARRQLCDILAASRDTRFERYQPDKVRYDSMTTGICHAYNGLLQWNG